MSGMTDGYRDEMAERYFDAQIAPAFRGLGMPDDVLSGHRQAYLRDVAINVEARAQLIEWANTGFDPHRIPR